MYAFALGSLDLDCAASNMLLISNAHWRLFLFYTTHISFWVYSYISGLVQNWFVTHTYCKPTENVIWILCQLASPGRLLRKGMCITSSCRTLETFLRGSGPLYICIYQSIYHCIYIYISQDICCEEKYFRGAHLPVCMGTRCTGKLPESELPEMLSLSTLQALLKTGHFCLCTAGAEGLLIVCLEGKAAAL